MTLTREITNSLEKAGLKVKTIRIIWVILAPKNNYYNRLGIVWNSRDSKEAQDRNVIMEWILQYYLLEGINEKLQGIVVDVKEQKKGLNICKKK